MNQAFHARGRPGGCRERGWHHETYQVSQGTKPNYYVHDGSHVSTMQTKKNKKKVAAQARNEDGVKPATPPQTASQSEFRPVSKKAKGKDKKKEETNDLDKALAELSIKCVVSISVFPPLSHVTLQVSGSSTTCAKYLYRHMGNQTF
jgi:hypothetical protein